MTERDALRIFHRMTEQQLGDFGESFCSRVFHASGFLYIPLSKIEVGRAPMFEGQKKSVLPDFDVAAKEFKVYVETKVKRQSVLFRVKNQLRHGIDRRRWEDYRRAEMLGRQDCALAIIELQDGETAKWSGTFLLEILRNLGEPWQGQGSERHMVYWRRKDFHDLDSFSATELLAIAKGAKPCNLRFLIERVFVCERQRELI